MTLARAKCDLEGVCRVMARGGKPAVVGLCDGPLEAAHIVERRYDDAPTVPTPDIVPLCAYHHARYDARRLSILEYLDHDEQAAAVEKLGIMRALRRLTSGSTVPVERPR
jgi:hypothetical protein